MALPLWLGVVMLAGRGVWASTTSSPPTNTSEAAALVPVTLFYVQYAFNVMLLPVLNTSHILEFTEQTDVIASVFNQVYQSEFGEQFLSGVVVDIRINSSSVEIDMELLFAELTPKPIPVGEDIVGTLKQVLQVLLMDIISINFLSAPQITSNVEFITNETFHPDLKKSSSAAFKTRSSLIKKELEPFFMADFSPGFICLSVRNLSNGSIVHDTDLIFTAGAALPSSSAVFNTMFKAANSGNLTFNVISINGTATASSASQAWTTKESPGPRPSPTFTLQVVFSIGFLLNETQIVELTDFDLVSAVFYQVYQAQYGDQFLEDVVKRIRINSTSLEILVDLVFDPNSPQPVPQSADIVRTLRQAVWSYVTDLFSITVINEIPLLVEPPTLNITESNSTTTTNVSTTSISTTTPTQPAMTTTEPPSTTSTTSSPPTNTSEAAALVPATLFYVQYAFNVTLLPVLNTSHILEFTEQTDVIASVFNQVYQSEFGEQFLSGVVVDIRINSSSVEIDMELLFAELTPKPIPVGEDIVGTLKQVLQVLLMDIISINFLSAPQITSNVEFITNETFHPDLKNSSSAAFKTRSSLIKKELEPFFMADFSPGFICLSVRNLSNGSIVHDTDLIFTAGAALPSSSAVFNTMFKAANSGNLTFNVISINGTATASSASQAWTTKESPGPRPSPTFTLQVVFSIGFLLNETQIVELTDFDLVSAVFYQVYQAQYGDQFLEDVVKRIRINSTSLEILVDLVFDPNSPQPVPQSADIVRTLRQAVWSYVTDLFSITVINEVPLLVDPPTLNITEPNSTTNTNVSTTSVSTTTPTQPAMTTTEPPSTNERNAATTTTQTVPSIPTEPKNPSGTTTTTQPVKSTTSVTSGPVTTTGASNQIDQPLTTTSGPLVTSNQLLTTTSTTASPEAATTAAPPRPSPVFILQVAVNIVFTPALSNPDSEEFKTEAAAVAGEFDRVYKAKYGPRFVRSQVTGFSVRSRADVVEAQVRLVFSGDSAVTPPPAGDVVNTLKQAAGLSIVEAGSISVISAPQTIANLRFTTGESFAPDLANSSSAAFQNRSLLVKNELEPFFTADFSPNFAGLTVRNFSQGSIIHDTDLTFTENATLPNSTAILNTMLRAARSGNLTFSIVQINGSDVTATSPSPTPASAAADRRVHLLTAASLVTMAMLSRCQSF
ncbi:mucin-5AC-like isoform X2 [Denticeps clupeoides]|uniref:mucin-5AC-like isoform X2 n=1 Tax=Denticeps clupeoides TaxID=299321 RepID=UPI0010A3BA15|nr:mucin-5AC-like isoform X2 [Denticeps clupeoides]